MPLTPPTPDDFDAAAPFMGKVLDILKWMLGTAVAALIASWRVLRLAGKAGREQRKYEENGERLDEVEKRLENFITVKDHDRLQEICQGNIKRMVETQVHDSVREIKDQLSDLNGTLCYFMGRLGVDPPEKPGRRRRSDPPTEA
jgi:gas vesicle protein